MKITPAIGKFIRYKRKKMGYTLRELAPIVGISHGHLCNIENARGFAHPVILQAIAAELGANSFGIVGVT